ncbi:MAG: ABC transporter substrate-binding protein, partial [Dehalococcoidia bacterium]
MRKRQPAVRSGGSSRLVALAVVIATGLLAIQLPINAAQEVPAGEISFGFWGDPAEADAYEAIVDAFEALHPAVDVQIEYLADADDFYARLATGYAAGDTPDVFLITYRRYGQFAAAGALEPVGPYLRQSTVIAEDGYFPEPMAAFTFNGELICLPQNLSSLVVYYNRDLFDASEVPYPAADWTWDDFLTAAQSLTEDTDGDGVIDRFGAGIEPSLVRVAPFIWQAGGELVDDIEHPTKLTIATPKAREGMRFLLDLSLLHHVVPSESEVLSQSLEDRFMAGNTAMLFQSRRVVPSLRQIDDFAWDVAPLPRGEAAAGILHSDAYCLSAGADNKAAAWAFIEFANGPHGQPIAAEVGRTV